MPFFKLIYLVFSEDRIREMKKFEEIINENYPLLFINKHFNLAEPSELLSNWDIMAPEYIFVEDRYLNEATYSVLRKMCRLEKLSETKIVVFGSQIDKLDKSKLKNCKAKMLKIPDYNNIDLNEIKNSLKEAFKRID